MPDDPLQSPRNAPPRPQAVDWFWLLVLVGLWGSAFLLNEIALGSFRPLEITVGRLSVGAIVMLGWNALRRRPLPRRRDVWAGYGAMALMGNALPFFLISWGQQGVPSGVAGILMAIMPLVVLVLAHLFLPGERMSRRRAAGFLIGFLGLAVLTGPAALGLVPDSAGQLMSQAAVLGGAICYGVAVIIARRSPRSDPVTAAACVLTLAAAGTGTVLIVGFLRGTPLSTGASPEAAVALVALGALCTAFATWIYFHVIDRAGATFLSLINYLIPLWAVGMGAAVLGERLNARAVVALVLILGGIVVSQRRSGKP